MFQSIKRFFVNEQENKPKQRPDVIKTDNMNVRRRKYQTVIRQPHLNFFQIISSQHNEYFWIVGKKYIQQNSQQYKKIKSSYQSCKDISVLKNKLPICKNFQEIKSWASQTPCQIILYEDIFFEIWGKINQISNVSGLHVISPDNYQIAKIANQNKIIKNIYQESEYILMVLQKNVQKMAIAYEQKGTFKKNFIVKNVRFPNFIKLSVYEKSQYSQYRLHLSGLMKLNQNEEEKLALKAKFIQHSRKKFPDDQQFIKQYQQNLLQQDKQILEFYTLDCFFYKMINNTLRMAKNTQEFCSIGQPFNRIFNSIKNLYQREKIVVYRGTDLTKSQSDYLQLNIGKYIQISGFISTSKKLQTAKNFAKQRENNTIFQIHLKKVDQKYKQYDYGFVDLQKHNISAYQNEDEILINALNIFKIQGKQQKQGFSIFKLSYGTVFQILDKKIQQLDLNQKHAYLAFKQIKQKNSQIKDIGEVFLRTYQPEKAIQVYQNQKKKIQQSLILVSQEKKVQITVNLANAYLANGDPQKALKQYQSLILDNTKQQSILKQSIIRSSITNYQYQKTILKTETKISNIYNIIDKYEDGQRKYKKTYDQISKIINNNWSLQLFWVGIQLLQQQIQAKNAQFLYEQAFQLINDLQQKIEEGLKKIRKSNQNFHQLKKLLIKSTQIYEKMSQIIEKLQKQKNNNQLSLLNSFDKKCQQLKQFIEQNSFEKGLLGIRRSQIIKRTSQFKFNEQVQLNNVTKSLNLVKKNINQNNQILAHVYNNIADTKKRIKSTKDYSQAIQYYKKQLKVQTLIYGSNDSRPLLTQIQIANCERQDKNTLKSIQIYGNIYNTKLFKTEGKYFIHAKDLFNMAQAYCDLGDNGLAFKSYQQAYLILQKQLSKNDFDKSLLRYKIKLKIGRLYISLSPKTINNLKKAQELLFQSHQFMLKTYHEQPHSDLAQSFNSLGVLFSAFKKYEQSRSNFQEAIKIFKKIIDGESDINFQKKSQQETKSLDIGKIRTNLAICYAQLYKQTKQKKYYNKSIQQLKSALQVFKNLQTNMKKPNPFKYEYQYIKAQIQIIYQKYQEAITAFQRSIQQQKQYLNQKKNLSNKQYGFNSIKEINKNPNMERNQSIILIKRNSKPQFLTSTQHNIKSKLKIGQCFIKLKKYQQAKTQLANLLKQIRSKIDKCNQNDLLKDNSNNIRYKYSKKLVYLQKIQAYLKEINDRLNVKIIQ